ncbi:hypothetical protein FLW16_30415 [Microbispora sp. KK1-11]|nr:hypothetical protein FLW16_30415 [Microbispora sp. KK1-11]
MRSRNGTSSCSASRRIMSARLASSLSDDFVHHRPDATRGKAEWLADVRAALVPLAGMQVEIRHVPAAAHLTWWEPADR